MAQAASADTAAGQQTSATYQRGLQDEKARIKVIRDVVVRTVAGPCFDADGLRHVQHGHRWCTAHQRRPLIWLRLADLPLIADGQAVTVAAWSLDAAGAYRDCQARQAGLVRAWPGQSFSGAIGR